MIYIAAFQSHLSSCVSFCPAVYSPTVFVHLPSFTDCATQFKDLFFWDTVFAMWRLQKWTGTPELTTQSGHFGLWGRRGDDCAQQQLRLHRSGNIATFKKKGMLGNKRKNTDCMERLDQSQLRSLLNAFGPTCCKLHPHKHLLLCRFCFPFRNLSKKNILKLN